MYEKFYFKYFYRFFFQYKLLEKEKRQLEIKLDKLDKLSRALQQERVDLQTTIKNLSKSTTTTIISSSVDDNPSPSATGEFLFEGQF